MDSDSDPTSDYADSIETSEFTSISTSRFQYSYEHGRRYQGFLHGRYGLPNDDVEQIREGVKHKLYVDYLHDGKLFRAPIGDYPQKIVDLGTGTGFWALDAAEQFPSARVIGCDLSPIQPHWTSPNLEFRVEDLEDESRGWTNIYADADLIHTRALLQTVRHPRRILQRAFDNLRPGGWIETHEIVGDTFSEDGTIDPDHPLNILWHLIDGPFTQVYGWNIYIAAKIPDILRSIGFVNVQTYDNITPLGRWPSDPKGREVGMFTQSITADWMDAMLAQHQAMGLSEEQADKLGQDLMDSMNNPALKAQLNWSDCWGQKPLS